MRCGMVFLCYFVLFRTPTYIAVWVTVWVKRDFKNMVELFSQKSARKISEIKRFRSFLWQVAPIKISTVFLVFSMVSAFLARFLELAASYCWLLLCNPKRYCGIYGILCGLHDSVNDLYFDGFPALCGSGHKSACSAQHGCLGRRRSMNRAWLHEICAGFSYSVFSAV